MSPAEVLALYPKHDDTVPSWLAARRAKIPDHPALEFETRVWTYAELDDASTLLAHALANRGARHDERIAFIGTNSDFTVILYFAVAKLGAMFVPLNPAATNEDLNYLLQHSRAYFVACEADLCDRVSSITAHYQRPPQMIKLEDLGSAASSAREALTCLARLAGTRLDLPLSHVKAEDPLVVIYTSGTTGFPKGVVHTQRNYVLAGEAFVARMYFQPTERVLALLPFFHINALFYSLGGAISAGGTLITARAFSASRFWHLAAQTRATTFNFLAAVGNILLKRSRTEFNPNHCLRTMYGGPISDEMYRVFREEFNVPTLIEGYGMTEIPGAACNPFLGPHKHGSIGKPAVHPRFPGNFSQLRIESDNGTPLPIGEVGELVVKTPIAFKEYLQDPVQTAAAFRNGWFLTGDLARQDEDGYFYFVARKKDIIRRRGENISGAELDRVISTHPDVLEAAAIAVPAELGEDEILVAVVLKPGASLSAPALIEWCRGRLAAMKVPRYVAFLPALPHTPSHRVAKHRLKADRDLLANAYDAEKAH